VTSQFFTARRTATALVLTAATALVVATTYGQASADAPLNLPADVKADYQLGGAYEPPSGTGVVVRDRTDEPADGLYNVCYVNGFQTQPGDEIDWWKSEHDDLLLRDGDGEYVGDVEWDELVLDITTPDKRAALAGIVGGWIEGCAAAGFQAVEIDNLDTFHRFPEFVEQSDALDYAELLVTTAHDAGLAIGQKNAAEIVAEARAIGFDFAVAEECGEWGECGDYVEEYDTAVLVVEYQRQYFDATCGEYGDRLSVVLRDVPLTTPGPEDDDEGAYVYDAC
jgi:hypothetical protein